MADSSFMSLCGIGESTEGKIADKTSKLRKAFRALVPEDVQTRFRARALEFSKSTWRSAIGKQVWAGQTRSDPWLFKPSLPYIMAIVNFVIAHGGDKQPTVAELAALKTAMEAEKSGSGDTGDTKKDKGGKKGDKGDEDGGDTDQGDKGKTNKGDKEKKTPKPPKPPKPPADADPILKQIQNDLTKLDKSVKLAETTMNIAIATHTSATDNESKANARKTARESAKSLEGHNKQLTTLTAQLTRVNAEMTLSAPQILVSKQISASAATTQGVIKAAITKHNNFVQNLPADEKERDSAAFRPTKFAEQMETHLGYRLISEKPELDEATINKQCTRLFPSTLTADDTKLIGYIEELRTKIAERGYDHTDRTALVTYKIMQRLEDTWDDDSIDDANNRCLLAYCLFRWCNTAWNLHLLSKRYVKIRLPTEQAVIMKYIQSLVQDGLAERATIPESLLEFSHVKIAHIDVDLIG